MSGLYKWILGEEKQGGWDQIHPWANYWSHWDYTWDDGLHFLKLEITSSYFMSGIIIKQVLTLYVKYNFPFGSGLNPASIDANEKKNKIWLVLWN